MIMKAGERWHCLDPVCRREVLVDAGSPEDGASPVCSCGSPMKKEYKPPVLRYLEFLSPESSEFVAGTVPEK